MKHQRWAYGMDERFGISGGGRSAEDEFRKLTGAVLTERSALGDAVLEGSPVEIKRATSNTLNQVRAVKYIPMAALYVPTDQWFVIPAHVIVLEVSRKRRGQHTENPFESATMSLGRLRHLAVERGELRLRTLQAIEESSRYVGLKEAMTRILLESRELAESSVSTVRRLITELGLEDAITQRGGGISGEPGQIARLFGED